jgi:hypothetical protein
MSPSRLRLVLACAFLVAARGALGQCPASVPAEGAPPPAPLPVFPSDNWWNADISTAPVDANSASYIAFINNGGIRRLHPDFGGEESRGSVNVYGMPYVVVNGAQPKVPVTFDYWDESDGVDTQGHATPFYPIPVQAVSQAHWIEGGAPGNVDQRDDSDRHLIIVDCTHRHLYELYNVYYDVAHGKWLAGSGAFFDMNANDRRPDGWTSADAGGLAIFPGLVRYDEAWNPGVTDIGHALRVTVRSTNGYVYPASHRAGSTPGALPMGARLRLRASVGGADPALRTGDPNMRKIFRAMQKHGLIVADNGSDMFVTGTFDTRWNNDILNPVFALLSASDFEVVQLGWKPTAAAAALSVVSVNPQVVVGGGGATGTVSLTLPAPAGGATVALSSASPAASVPATATVAAGGTSTTFAVTTTTVATSTLNTLTASNRGTCKTATLRGEPAAAIPTTVKKVALSRTSVIGGTPVGSTVILSVAAPAGGVVVNLRSLNTSVLTVPARVTVAAGATSQSFTIATLRQTKNTGTAVYATYAGAQKYAVLKVLAR